MPGLACICSTHSTTVGGAELVCKLPTQEVETSCTICLPVLQFRASLHSAQLRHLLCTVMFLMWGQVQYHNPALPCLGTAVSNMVHVCSGKVVSTPHLYCAWVHLKRSQFQSTTNRARAWRACVRPHQINWILGSVVPLIRSWATGVKTPQKSPGKGIHYTAQIITFKARSISTRRHSLLAVSIHLHSVTV